MSQLARCSRPRAKVSEFCCTIESWIEGDSWVHSSQRTSDPAIYKWRNMRQMKTCSRKHSQYSTLLEQTYGVRVWIGCDIVNVVWTLNATVPVVIFSSFHLCTVYRPSFTDHIFPPLVWHPSSLCIAVFLRSGTTALWKWSSRGSSSTAVVTIRGVPWRRERDSRAQYRSGSPSIHPSLLWSASCCDVHRAIVCLLCTTYPFSIVLLSSLAIHSFSRREVKKEKKKKGSLTRRDFHLYVSEPCSLWGYKITCLLY